METQNNLKPVLPHQKASRINLDKRFYGTFAEIGAGQEVARWFFVVGGASGTLAKTISAYDMSFSDAIYGKSERYVSQLRLQKMLDYEYDLLVERLDAKRGAGTSFFAFSNTVSARNYLGTNECHGWMGIKFQTKPQTAPSEIILHVNMRDRENIQQQEALGIIGVNLTYGAFYLNSEPEKLIASLLDGLSTSRIEVDMVKFSGPCFDGVDNRLMSLQLVVQGLSGAVLIGAGGGVLQPSEVLRKKNILIERGSFRPLTKVNLDMLDGARSQFQHDSGAGQDEIVELMEITMSNLLSSGKIDHCDFLARADTINAVGKMVLISDYAQYYKLAGYLQRHTKGRIGIVLGAPNLKELFDIKYYEELEGGILESFGRLFKNDLKLYIYPFMGTDPGKIVTAEDVAVPGYLVHLFRHLKENGYIEPIESFHKEYLGIFPADVLCKITACDCSWEEMVPGEVARCIKARKFFGYKS
ncbi:MAG: nicotinate-nucleotide adenylyltransferase [Elusimicrobia bacterium CG1_02_56_21]|nr:MAG: nicotinate-nucleotide adenylyltransferase [Elusimicrobia bacterium CG1_02_56_21]